MSETTREDILVLARQAGLDLPEAYREELYSAWQHVQRMTARIRKDRPHADEPAHVFVPATFED